MKTIGIIGAGSAGLCALRHVLEQPEFVPVIWEHSSQLGGTWVFTPHTGKDQYGYPIHSSMYGSLRTNIPKEVMGFPDFPFKRGGNSFIHHSEVLQYLNEYANRYALTPWIKFGHHVYSVDRVDDEVEASWEVKVRNLEDDSITTTFCYAVYVCSGHYSVPKIPDLEGMKIFKGTVIHSHDYRVSNPFRRRRVIVLGAGASGLDIALEVSKVAETVYISHNSAAPIPSKLPANMLQVRGIKEVDMNGFILMDDSYVEADDLILCTGYEFSFPFLLDSCGVNVEGNQVKPLYKHMINSTHPTMAFIGVAFQVLPFPVFDIQVQFFLEVLLGKVNLPTKSMMDAETEEEYKKRLSEGMPPHHFHRLAELQWTYVAELAKIADLTRLPEVIEKIYQDARTHRMRALMTYKETNYLCTGQTSFQSCQY